MNTSGSHPPSPLGSVAATREPAKQYSLHPLERTLGALAISLLFFLPWALGGMKLWGQYTAVTLAALAFIVALIPRRYDERYHASGHLRLIMWPKLLRFPIFWLGLVYFALIVCQIFNPAWTYRSSSAGWWLESIDYIRWLPHGIEGTPFKVMNGWRTLMIHGAAWLLVCALWVGITRRKTAKLILTGVALNGVLVAIVVILQRLTETKKLLWLWDAPSRYFAAGFIYKNHAGEFLCLIVALCLGLAWWHMRQAEKELKKSHPGAVWALAALLVLVGQMFTYARAATAVSLMFYVVILLAFIVRLFFRTRGGTPPLATAATALLGVGFMAVAITQMNTNTVLEKFEKLFKEDQFASVRIRQIATTATYEMAQHSPISGHGGGSFRFLFPLYQQHHPQIFTQIEWFKIGDTYKQGPRRLYWEYAHNDYVQFLAEFGWVGATLVLITLACLLIAAWQVSLVTQFGLLLMAGGAALVAATAAVDFPFHNPAVLFTTVTVLALVLRWAQVARR